MVKKVLVFGIVLFVLFSFGGCYVGSSHGIPHGVFRQVFEDENGEITLGGGGELAWLVERNKAEHRYLVFTIVKEDGQVFFEIEREEGYWTVEDKVGVFRYEVDYDSETKILTVVMPSRNGSPHHYPTRALETEAFRFKR
jgi:hypothetical protein